MAEFSLVPISIYSSLGRSSAEPLFKIDLASNERIQSYLRRSTASDSLLQKRKRKINRGLVWDEFCPFYAQVSKILGPLGWSRKSPVSPEIPYNAGIFGTLDRADCHTGPVEFVNGFRLGQLRRVSFVDTQLIHKGGELTIQTRCAFGIWCDGSVTDRSIYSQDRQPEFNAWDPTFASCLLSTHSAYIHSNNIIF